MSNISKPSDNISVYVRLRPYNCKDHKTDAIRLLNSKDIVISTNNKRKFSYDAVFGTNSTQKHVYELVAKPLISEILSGYNCTVFAYGQTGTGKTFTLTEGISCIRPFKSVENVCFSPNENRNFTVNEESGLIPRVLSDLFDQLNVLQQQYAVRCSYLEIYNEDLRDLLSVNDDPCHIRIYDDQRNKGSIIINGIEEVTIHSITDAMRYLQRGQEKRQTASTNMNDRSSRSHTIFTVIVHTREIGKDGEELVKIGKINLVDLAGSENIHRSGAVEQRAREAGNINQSLLTLGRVIKALSEKKSHIPFRESKLTRILQDSLGGRTKTSIIAAISPCLTNLEETLSTLDYAHRARGITNKPETNQRMSQKRLISQYVEQISRLQRDLLAARTGKGVFVNSDNYDQLILDQNHKTEELSLKNTMIKDMEKQLNLLKTEKDIREREWIDISVAFEETRVELEKMKIFYERAESEKREQEFLAQKFEANAENLHQEAKGLINIIKASSYNESVLSDKLTKVYKISKENNDVFTQSCADMQNTCRTMHESVIEFKSSSQEFDKATSELMNNISRQHVQNIGIVENLKNSINGKTSDLNNLFDDLVKENDTNFCSFKKSVVDRCKEFMETTISSHALREKELQSMLMLVLQYEERRKADASKLYEIVNCAIDVSAQGLFMNNLQQSQNYFLKEFDILRREFQTLKKSTDAILSKISRHQQKQKEFVHRQFDEIGTAFLEIQNENFQRQTSLAQEVEESNNRVLNLTKKMEEFVADTSYSILKSKQLTFKKIHSAFNKMSEEMDMYIGRYLTRINELKGEIQAAFEFIHKNVDEPSVELLQMLHNLQNVGDQMATHTDSFSQQCNQYTSDVCTRLNQLEVENKNSSHDLQLALYLKHL